MTKNQFLFQKQKEKESYNNNKIIEWLTKYNIKGIINVFGDIDIYSNLNLKNSDISELPYKINKVGGNFYINASPLKTLKNFPNEVGGDLSLANTMITSLEGLPEKIGGSLYIQDCANLVGLTSLFNTTILGLVKYKPSNNFKDVNPKMLQALDVVLKYYRTKELDKCKQELKELHLEAYI